MESLVTDVLYTVLIGFPVIAQHSKGTHYFHGVVGLVVYLCQCGGTDSVFGEALY